MTVGQLLKQLDKLLDSKAISLDTELIYSSDDEGNSYHPFVAGPSKMYVEGKLEHYIDPVNIHDDESIPESLKDKTLPVLCIN